MGRLRLDSATDLPSIQLDYGLGLGITRQTIGAQAFDFDRRADGRLAEIRRPQGLVAAYTYEGAGPAQRITFGNGVEQARVFDDRGRKRAGLLEPQLKRVLAGTRVETPPTWYDPTEIGLPGVPGKKVCFRATVFPLFSNESEVIRIAVMHEVVAATETKTPKKPASAAAPQPMPSLPRMPANSNSSAARSRRACAKQKSATTPWSTVLKAMS